jgi:DNA polymerase-3 subunit beta
LQDILRSLPESAEVSLALDDKRLQLKAGKSRFNLQTLPAEDFPRMSTATGRRRACPITQRQMKRLLGTGPVRHGAAGHPLLPQRIAAGGKGQGAAHGGHRWPSAGLCRRNPPEAPAPIEVILPRKTVLELSRQLADNDDPLEIQPDTDPGPLQLSAASNWCQS